MNSRERAQSISYLYFCTSLFWGPSPSGSIWPGHGFGTGQGARRIHPGPSHRPEIRGCLLYNRGLIYSAKGNQAKAAEDFISAIELNQNAADAYCNRATAYFFMGQTDKALADFAKTLEISPMDGDALYDRSIVYQVIGKAAEAGEDLRRAAEAGHELALEALRRQEKTSSVDGTGWRRDLSGVEIPSRPAAGRIHGDPVTIEKAVLENGILTLRDGKDFFPDHALVIFFFLKKGEALENRIFEYSAESGFGRPHIHMKWKPEGKDIPETEILMKDYAMSIRFGKRHDDEIPGKIYICLPDEMKSFVAGEFSAHVKG
ncbi:MAG: tetratricopeptide repeat protein [Deltaproteobacteria bacterium]|nr:tetratricopeptide repeat protein [Deltaproteobacteria bacterium]MBW1924289.1 tetratricopeptide repeat protein [Deltaproteobacteria bacterium]MBW1949904.1 tetratricopeptide repeat protein [Deltaproteobacteria bacterium]MBW2008133.1 tetratricopeptide repeat protein [Deltaproteobacteria bacterium]MBW2102641.1 tetratricopeptide repeat protein [Deltaproteobacteria bacterium]